MKKSGLLRFEGEGGIWERERAKKDVKPILTLFWLLTNSVVWSNIINLCSTHMYECFFC